jgi:hypothetical protein
MNSSSPTTVLLDITAESTFQESYEDGLIAGLYIHNAVRLCLSAGLFLVGLYITVAYKFCSNKSNQTYDRGGGGRQNQRGYWINLINIVFVSSWLFLIACGLASVYSIIYLRTYQSRGELMLDQMHQHFHDGWKPYYTAMSMLSFTGFLYPIWVILRVPSTIRKYLKEPDSEDYDSLAEAPISARFLIISFLGTVAVSVGSWLGSVIGESEKLEAYGLPWISDIWKFNTVAFVIRIVFIGAPGILAFIDSFYTLIFIICLSRSSKDNLSTPTRDRSKEGRGKGSGNNPNSTASRFIFFDPRKETRPIVFRSPASSLYASRNRRRTTNEDDGETMENVSQMVLKGKTLTVLLTLVDVLFLAWTLFNIAYMMFHQFKPSAEGPGQPPMPIPFLFSLSWPHLTLSCVLLILLRYAAK